MVFLSRVPRPAAMPVCRTLLPVVDAAGIQVAEDEFMEEREKAIANGHTQFSVVPTNDRPVPLPGLAPFGVFVYDNGQCEFARRIDPRYMEDYTFVCCCHPFCDSAIRLDLFQEVVSITERKLCLSDARVQAHPLELSLCLYYKFERCREILSDYIEVLRSFSYFLCQTLHSLL